MRVVTALIPGPERIPGACEIYRITMPLYYLKKYGWQGQWMFADALREAGSQALLRLVANTHLFVIPRATVTDEAELNVLQDLFAIMRQAGAKIVYEVDDDYTNEHRQVHEGDCMSVAAACDAITVTTPFLADLMTERTGRPAYVLPNMLDPQLFRNGSEPGRVDRIRTIISLTGSPTHAGDWEVLRDVLPEIAQRDDVRIVIGGFHPDYLQGLPNTEYIPPLDYPTYTRVLRGSDIILAPVNPEDQFNYGKSPLKAIEGMGATRTLRGTPAGAAVIATDYPVYRLAVKHGVNGLLVNQTPEEWCDAILDLLDDKEQRIKMQRRAHKDVWKHFDISKGARQWAEAYNQIVEQ